MDWKSGYLPNIKLKYVNFIDYIGCNIIGLCRVGGTWDTKTYNDTPGFAQSSDGWIREVFNGLKKLTESDGDYSQLCLVQLTKRSRGNLIDLFKENLPIAFTQEVRGGHGNSPLILIGIDLAAIRNGWVNPKWVEVKPEPKPKRKYVKSGKYAKKRFPMGNVLLQQELNHVEAAVLKLNKFEGKITNLHFIPPRLELNNV